MKTIPRNHKTRIAALKQTLTACQVYSLETGFAGVTLKSAWPAWRALDRYHSARLTDHGNGRYVIRVHSNLWYELREG